MAEVSDLDITRNLTLALLGAAELQGKTIGVIANKGDVRLTAVLDNQSQIDMALRLAHGAQGVHTVHDELTLKP
jgi:osmotically-inducible protein OsmY